MKVLQISNLIKDSGLSPEKLAIYFQVSNMTLRRWLKKAPTFKIPAQYETNIYQGVLLLVRDKLLEKENELVLESYEHMQKLSTVNSFMMMDLSEDEFSKGVQNEEGVVELCLKLGQKEGSVEYIQKNEEQLKSYEVKSESFKERVLSLVRVMKSEEVQRAHKYVAIGALFYLLFPFDFIPDSIPGVGLMDDIAVLGVAMEYYLKLNVLKR